MQFSVGDKVVHPRYGPGAITGIERKDLMDGPKYYYIIDMPGQGLTVQVPVGKADAAGMRLAMSQSRLAQVLVILQRKPHLLPQDYRQRQERIGAQLRTGLASEWAMAVRDLTWHQELAHLTKTDIDNLRKGSDLLAAEMSLVSGDAVSVTGKLIATTMIAAIESVPD